MASLSILLGTTISNFIAKIGITLILFGSSILFYEGTQFLNWYPLNKIPGISWVIKGEIYRRTELASHKATLKERLIWEENIRLLKQEQNKLLKIKNDKIFELSKYALELEDKLKKEHEIIIGNLRSSIEESIKENKNEKDIIILNSPIPSRVWNSIR